jgi:protein TonB
VAGGVEGGTPGGVVGGRGNGPLPAGQVAHPPALLARVAPQYPHAARQRGVNGLVLLEAILDTQGRIHQDIKVLQSVPDLNEAAMAALRQWRFEPARDEHGRSVAVVLEVPFRFVLR